MASTDDEEKKKEWEKEFAQIHGHHKEYMAHLMRTKHQGDYYRYVTNNLKPGQVVVIIDYKMKLELGQRIRENQREWYGKRGISIHGFFVIAQVIRMLLIEMCALLYYCCLLLYIIIVFILF